MKFSIGLKCPHCNCNEHFTFHDVTQFHSKNFPVIQAPGQKTNFSDLSKENIARFYGVTYCPRPNCGGPVLAWLESNRFGIKSNGQYHNTIDWIYTGPTPVILGVWPTPTSPDDSENWPENLRTVFKEVQEDAALKRDAARIVGACRSVLEVALKSLGYGKAAGKNLSDRIDAARADGILTESMRLWAHKTRIDGNDALHELNATSEEAIELVNFIRTFLDLTFDLPKRIENQRDHSAKS